DDRNCEGVERTLVEIHRVLRAREPAELEVVHVGHEPRAVVAGCWIEADARADALEGPLRIRGVIGICDAIRCRDHAVPPSTRLEGPFASKGSQNRLRREYPRARDR